MNIFSARVILQSIVETPEAIINDPLKDFIFPYSTDQIRLAVKILSESIGKPTINGHAQKKTSLGTLHSHFFKNAVCLGLDQNGIDDPKLEFWLPTNQNAFIPRGTQQAVFKETDDSNIVKKTSTSSVASSKNDTILTTEISSLWLGFRWMSANLLIWEKTDEIIMPEDLGKSSVPRIDTGSEKVNAVDLFCGPQTVAKLKIK